MNSCNLQSLITCCFISSSGNIPSYNSSFGHENTQSLCSNNNCCNNVIRELENKYKDIHNKDNKVDIG